MLFDEKFIALVEENPIQGIENACKITLQLLDKARTDNQNWNDDEHNILWESSSFVQLVIETNDIDVNAIFPVASGDIRTNCDALLDYIHTISAQVKAHCLELKINSYKGLYKTAFKSTFAYEFSQGDLDRIQELVNELRETINNDDKFEDDHKRRLLKRLEELQSELHKRVSDLDRFWGLIGDAGVVLGKFGKDAKPIVDRVREMAEIVWKTQARAEELPSGSSNPMLDHNT